MFYPDVIQMHTQMVHLDECWYTPGWLDGNVYEDAKHNLKMALWTGVHCIWYAYEFNIIY